MSASNFRSLQDLFDYNTRMATSRATRRYRNVRYAHAKVEALSASQMETKYATRCRRNGKTERDHGNGAPARNAARKRARVDWQKDSRARAETFPV